MSGPGHNARQQFMSVAVMEHHASALSELSTYDLAERLVDVWEALQADAQSGVLDLSPNCILVVNAKIANAFGAAPGKFNRENDWVQFIEACGNVDESPTQTLSWIFSDLYWNRLTCFKFSTAWLYMNALRVQHGLPALYLTLDRLGPFLENLSSSGPPLHDGQTLYPDDYARPA